MHHLSQQIYRMWVPLEVCAQFHEIFISIHTPFWERALHLGELCRALPQLLTRSSEALEYLENLPYLRLSVEKWLSVSELKEDAAQAPDINSSAIDF